ncbi:hypothetical protein QBC40DRAFT_314102 [Triangularia verruculosa]|uniref:BRCT domain-containing protein n=1 Tax=Triangularia verruculosa TaxID=2587418 RepID=A0AAN7ASM4_9PEZI|nr:hypothetical protein QBC40DRAFT_314102 [Triangularia verruculosa]
MVRGIHFRVKDLTFKEKAMFAKFTIAVSGSFHNKTHWTDANLARWITLRGGRYYKGPGVPREVTHFVTDENELKARTPKAVEALKNRRIQIVPLEWLEFSMIGRKVLPVVSGGEYDFRDKLKREAEKERRLRVVAMGLVMAERAVNTNLYRVYRDGTFFRYEVELFRESNGGQGTTPPQKEQALKEVVSPLPKETLEVDVGPKKGWTYDSLPGPASNEKEVEGEVEEEAEPETPTKVARTDRGEKYTLTLYESIAKPPLYFFCAKYSKSSTDTLPKYYRPSETPQLFWTEYTHFIEFFHKKTGVEWRKRLLFCGEGKPPVGGKRKGKEREAGDGEGAEGLERGWFRYCPPTGGKPVGWVPGEYVPKEEES